MDHETTNEFESLWDFLRQNMVTKHDLKEQMQDLRSQVASKDELRALTIIIDRLAKLVKDFYQEVHPHVSANYSDGSVDSAIRTANRCRIQTVTSATILSGLRTD